MNPTLRKLVLLGLLSGAAPLSGCATIAGTLVSPITGGVDLCTKAVRPHEWYIAPFVFLGGAIAGPFVAMYNGINYDVKVFKRSQAAYWEGFDQVFRPFDMIF